MYSSRRWRARSRAITHGVTLFVVSLCINSISMMPFGANVADAKTPGKTYCFYRKCHRVKTLSETERLVGETISLHTSHYDSCHRDRYNPCGLTSSGEPFFADRPDNAASPIYPNGTKLLVWSPASKQAAVVRINNAGPYWGNRKLDVSRALARELGFERRGVTKLQTRILSSPTRAEARYKKNRRYAKVRGPIGKFDSIDEAEKGLAVLLAFDAMTTAALGPSGAGAMQSVERPFEVAAKVTGGRAFASIQPRLERWPVVARQYAQVNWPVVEDAAKPNAVGGPVRVASADAAATRKLASWPVVAGTERVEDKRQVVTVQRVAIAWPVVTGNETNATGRVGSDGKLGVLASTTRLTDESLMVRMAALAPRLATGQKRERVAKSKLRSRVKTSKRKRSAKKIAAKRDRRRSMSKKRRTSKAERRRANRKRKVARRPQAQTRSRRLVRPQRSKAKQQPYVAVRQILHRALGRNAS